MSFSHETTTARYLISAERADDFRMAIFLHRGVALTYADRMADLGYRVIVTTVA